MDEMASSLASQLASAPTDVKEIEIPESAPVSFLNDFENFELVIICFLFPQFVSICLRKAALVSFSSLLSALGPLLVHPTISPPNQVLRRAQLGLQTEEPEAGAEGDAEKKKGKGTKRGRGRGRGKGKGKGRGKGKGVRNQGEDETGEKTEKDDDKEEGHQGGETEMFDAEVSKEDPEETKDVHEQDQKETPEIEQQQEQNKEEIQEKKRQDKKTAAKTKVEKKKKRAESPELAEGNPGLERSSGSKRQKGAVEETSEDQERKERKRTVEKPGRSTPEVQVPKKAPRRKKGPEPIAEKKDEQGQEEEEKKKKTNPVDVKDVKGGRKRSGEVATFARRVEPKGDLPKAKWNALKEAFVKEVKPTLTCYSAHEEWLRVGG